MCKKPGPKPIPVPKDWRDDMTGWNEWMKVKGYTDDTRYSWRHRVGRFARHCQKSPDSVSTRDLIRYLARDGSRNTLRSDHSALNSFYSYLTGMGVIDKNPMTKVPLAKRKTIKLPPAPQEAVDRAEHMDARTRLMTLLMADMGLRRNEVAAISAADITGHGNDMTLTVHGKGDKDRIVPVDQRVTPLLEKRRPEHGWLFPSMNHGVANGDHISAGRVGKIVSAATGSPAHSFRRKFATDMWQATGDLMAIKEMLGHNSLTTTQAYIWTTQQQLRTALDRLDEWARQGRTSSIDPERVLEAYGLPRGIAEELVEQIESILK